MKKYNVSIVHIKDNNAPGANFTLMVEAEDFLDCCKRLPEALTLHLKESGLIFTDSTSEVSSGVKN